MLVDRAVLKSWLMRMFMLEASLFLYPCISHDYFHLYVSQPIVYITSKG